MTIKKGLIGTVLSAILLLGLALPVHAEVEIQRSTCEMTINSAKHPSSSSPSNATGDCNGLVFGFYNSEQDAFRTFGMVRYDVEYSGQQFIVATPAGQHAEAVMTVYTVKEAPKPQPKPEEPKEESKPTPVEKPKEEPKKETPKQESKPSSEKPKEEPKKESKPSQPVEQPKEEAKEQPKEDPKTETVADKNESTNQEDGDNNNSNSESNSESESVEIETSDKPKLAELGGNQKIHSTLEKDGSEIARGQIETPQIELASSDIANDTNESSTGFIVYVATGIGIILLGGLGWWLYKRKVS